MTGILFHPFRLHDLALANRVVLSPMTRGRAGAARLPNRLMAEYYTQRSSAGLLITEGVTISEEANGWSESPGIYTDEMAVGWKLTTDAVHAKGGLIFLQLWHTGRASHSSFHGGNPAVSPSTIRIGDGETRRRAAIDEIFAEDCVFYDPSQSVYCGRDEIDRIAGAIRATHPDFRYQPIAEPEEVGNGGRIRWVSGRPREAPAYAGTDFVIARDGRITALYLFFDKLP
jgi:hypothetical protein